MSTTWDAPLAHRLRRSRPRAVRVPPLLIGLGRVLLFLAWAVLMAWAILFRPAALAAQDAPPDTTAPVLRPGDRVRVELDGAPAIPPFVARVVELRTDTLAVSRARAGRSATVEWIPVSEIQRLQVSRGRKHGFFRSVGSGLGGGAFLGGLLGLGLSNWLDDCPESDPHCDDEGEHLYVVPWVAAAGATLGLIGGISRGLSSEERWEDVPTGRLALGPATGVGFVVAVSIRVR